MQLMQFNYFLENGPARFDRGAQGLAIDYDRYHEVVGALLKEVLAVQRAGDNARAEAFIERLTRWDERHEALAARCARRRSTASAWCATGRWASRDSDVTRKRLRSKTSRRGGPAGPSRPERQRAAGRQLQGR